MINILRGDFLFPCVAARIKQIQTSTRIVKSDARAATILCRFRIIGVVTGEDERIILLRQTDIDCGRRIAVHTVFEGILNE